MGRQFGWMPDVDLPEEALKRAAKVLEEGEEVRHRRVADHAARKELGTGVADALAPALPPR